MGRCGRAGDGAGPDEEPGTIIDLFLTGVLLNGVPFQGTGTVALEPSEPDEPSVEEKDDYGPGNSGNHRNDEGNGGGNGNGKGKGNK